MTEEFDTPKIAAHFAQAHVEQFLKSTVDGAKGLSGHVRALLGSTYQTYVERILDRYGKGKSFFVRNESTPLYNFFVPLSLSNQVREFDQPDARDLCSVSPFAIIIGSGGSGKSMMMRHFLVSCINAGSKTPIFIELRQLNQTQDTIRELMLRTLHDFGLEVDERVLEPALATGQFLLLLDGFDELERSARKRIAQEVQKLAEKYPKNWIVMSSRPDTTLQGWDTFAEYTVEPLSLETASELVEKLTFDEQVKRQFINDMIERLFEDHKSFLSNPLLLSIMLLTYSDIAHIPHKIRTFYGQAYETLFHRHDALKSGFQRERRSQLDIQEFARAFAAFSLLSYDNREFGFTRSRALEVIRDARNASMLTFEAEAFLDDAIQANCLLIEEGLDIVFAHRSFQEYFVARFIHASPPEIKVQLVERYAAVASSDSVIALLWEIDPYIVERHYILPMLVKMREVVGSKKTLGPSHLLRFIRHVFASFHIHEVDVSVGATGREEFFAWSTYIFAFSRYRDPHKVFDGKDFIIENDQLAEAIISDHGPVTEISSDKLKPRGKFIALLAEHGTYWGLSYLRELHAIEREISRKHQENRESLESVLASSRTPRRRARRVA